MSEINSKITVLLPVHNGQKFLAEAIESILQQTLKDFILLIVDDGSTDQSPEIISHYAKQEGRIRIITNKKNIGLVATLNLGLSAIETPYVARMDCDDISLPGRLEIQLAFMEAHPEVGACGSWATTVTESGPGPIFKPFSGKRLTTQYWRPVPLLHPTACLRTSLAKELGYRFEAQHCEDYDLWLRIRRRAKLANIPKVLLQYRIHGQNISNLHRQLQISNTFKLFCQEFPDITVNLDDFRSLIADSYDYSPIKRQALKIRVRSFLPEDLFWSLRDDLLYALRWQRRNLRFR